MAVLKERLRRKEVTFGSWLSFADLQTTEMMARAGFDWLVIDLEHTSISVAEMRAMIQIIDLSGVEPMVRVGENDPLLIKRALDAGARGIIVPMVSSPSEAQAAVDAMFYPPFGTRGVGLARAQDFGAGFEEYRQRHRDELVLIVQIEHYQAVDKLKEILEVEGVDGFIVGPYDLSGSLGVPGEFDHPDSAAAMQRVAKLVRSGAKPGGLHVVHSDRGRIEQLVGEGYCFIAYGTEMIFLSEKLQVTAETLIEVRAGIGAGKQSCADH